jgi:hypothetical protein
MLIYLVIILFGLARHEAKYQEYLFHAVSRADEGVDGKHLLPWVVDDLKGTIMKSQGFIIPNFISKIEDKKYEVFMHALL